MPSERRQFVAVKFRAGDRRTYTYHNDGPPVACGDEVKVPDRQGDAWRRVTVHEVSWTVPTFETKAILGLADDPPPRDLLSSLDDSEMAKAGGPDDASDLGE